MAGVAAPLFDERKGVSRDLGRGKSHRFGAVRAMTVRAAELTATSELTVAGTSRLVPDVAPGARGGCLTFTVTNRATDAGSNMRRRERSRRNHGARPFEEQERHERRERGDGSSD
jgi:hypothetical protein